MAVVRRYKPQVRATRAYLAGFGTSGSLLAGAALLFILASAIVAFRGWPQVATQPSTAVVTVPASSPAATSHDPGRLRAVLAARAVATPRNSPRGHAVSRRSRTGTVAPGGGSTPSAGGGSNAPIATSANRGAPGTCSGAGCAVSTSQGTVSGVTTTAAQTISNAGSAVGSAVNNTAGAVAGAVSGTSPQAAGAVQGAGNTAAGTVSGATTTASGTVTAVGNALGGGK